MDILRGFAILGILLANIVAFATPVVTSDLQMAQGSGTQIEGFVAWLVAGKYRSLLAILFGMGLGMQFQSQSARGNWPNAYYRRTLILMIFGLIHAILLWFGDILFIYSIIAFISMQFVKLNTRQLTIIATSLIILGVLMGLVLAVSSTTSADMLTGLPESWQYTLSAEGETFAYSEGSYGLQLLYRLGSFSMMLMSIVFISFDLVGLFLLGIVFSRIQLLQNLNESRPLLKKFLAIGLIGLLLNLPAYFAIVQGWQFQYLYVVELGLAAPVSLGIIGAIGLTYLSFPKLLSWLQPIGKMALSCYLMQTLICTTYFYSYGFGMFGKLTEEQLYFQVVPAVWIANLLFATLWLKFFNMGPMEYLWRKMSKDLPSQYRNSHMFS